jgi:ribosomal-protein-alanine N-acetyltransferase
MTIDLSINDAEIISQIHQSCFDDGWSEKSFFEMLSQNAFFGFFSKEKTGFILGKIVCEEIEIITICVLPNFRRRGIGKLLMETIDVHAKTCSVDRIFLEVSEDNVIAQKMYKNFGYKEIAERRGYYQTQTCRKNAIIMMKNATLNNSGKNY